MFYPTELFIISIKPLGQRGEKKETSKQRGWQIYDTFSEVFFSNTPVTGKMQ